MNSRKLQQTIKNGLEIYFGKVVLIEWTISRNATDMFKRNTTRYTPRVDVAVNTLGINPGNYKEELVEFWNKKAPRRLKNMFRINHIPNKNPRCTLAVEIVYSGSSKHILGDITNASMMGLYGIVVPSQKMMPKVKRIFRYIKAIRDTGKAPETLFHNVVIVPEEKFVHLISR